MHLSNLWNRLLGAWNAPSRKSSCCRRSTSSWITRARLGSCSTDQHAGIESAWKSWRDCGYWDKGQTPFVKAFLVILLSIWCVPGWRPKSFWWQPVTVSLISLNAGFEDYGKLQWLSQNSDDQLVDQAEETAALGVSSPEKLLIQTLKAAGRTTVMTGDGVNDILALREADRSIVMAAEILQPVKLPILFFFWNFWL